jgi:CubicO group peptidase (beta-lactamase class C family)
MMHIEALDAHSECTASSESSLLPILPLAMHPVRPAELLECIARYHVPGVSIAVIADFRLVWAGGYGVCEVGRSDLVTPNTLFQACSVSKPVTAIAALRLVQEGLLNLDEDLNSYLVSWKVPTNQTGQSQVTLRHLLSHTAGLTLCWYLGFRPGSNMPTLLHVLNGEAPAKTRAVRVQIPPGTRFRYSESHFALLQQLLTDLTRTPFPDLMQTLVFEPLGMRDSSYHPPLSAQQFSTTATGHYFDGMPIKGKWRIFPALAASGLWTTPFDLAQIIIEIQLARAGWPSKVLDKRSVDQLLTPQTPPDGRQWGLGFELKGQGEAARFRHTGDNIGFKCFLQGFCERGMGIVLMCNGDNGEIMHKELFQIIAKEYGRSTTTPVGALSRPRWRQLPHHLAVGTLRRSVRLLHF